MAAVVPAILTETDTTTTAEHQIFCFGLRFSFLVFLDATSHCTPGDKWETAFHNRKSAKRYVGRTAASWLTGYYSRGHEVIKCKTGRVKWINYFLGPLRWRSEL